MSRVFRELARRLAGWLKLNRLTAGFLMVGMGIGGIVGRLWGFYSDDE